MTAQTAMQGSRAVATLSALPARLSPAGLRTVIEEEKTLSRDFGLFVIVRKRDDGVGQSIASEAVMPASGSLRRATFRDGAWRDLILFARLRERRAARESHRSRAREVARSREEE